MKDGKNEFLGLLCNLYLVVLLVALPLYTGKGYWQLGDTKYMLFRNLSALCLGGWLLAGMPGRICALAEHVRVWRKRPGKAGTVQGAADEVQCAAGTVQGTAGAAVSSIFSRMDGAVLAYSVCVILSAVCSDYGMLAWAGYEGWYMGAVSQLMFAGIYFFVSRQYGGAVWPVYFGEAAFFLVTLLGLLHRLGIDPLGLMASWGSKDWEYSHMLSTLGNINWLCGYYSVALAFVIVHFLQENRLWLRLVLYLVSVWAFVLLLVQGSQSGLLILGTCVVVCLFMGRRQCDVWGKVSLLLAGTFFSMPLLEMLMRLRGSKAAVVADGNIFAFTSWYGWTLAAVACLFLFLLFGRKEEGLWQGNPGVKGNGDEPWGNVSPETGKAGIFTLEKRDREGTGAQKKGGRGRRKLAALIALTAGGTIIVSAGLLFWSRMDDSFGSGRGFLWRIAVESFVGADGKDKLLGAGPDCYGEAVFDRLGADTEVWKGEHWEGAVFTNAHNEILSQLCNVGILGTAGYLAIFLVGLCRYGRDYRGRQEIPEKGGKAEQEGIPENQPRQMGRGTLGGVCAGGLGLLVLSMYGIHSLVSFQQVLNTPLLFLALGMCEAEKRRETHMLK